MRLRRHIKTRPFGAAGDVKYWPAPLLDPGQSLLCGSAFATMREIAGRENVLAGHFVDSAPCRINRPPFDGIRTASLGPGVCIDAHQILTRFSLPRSEERSVGKEYVSTCRSRWSPYH